MIRNLKFFITLLLVTLTAQQAMLAQVPVIKWDFETIKNRGVVEASTNRTDTIEGNFEW